VGALWRWVWDDTTYFGHFHGGGLGGTG
jgi:hypothetical protein